MNEKLLDLPMPHSEDAEASAIGTMLIDPDAAAIVAAELKADDFFLIRTKTIFTTICAMLERGWPLDEITVTDELARKGVLDQCGGRDYISRIILRTPSAVGAESYCRMIRDYAVQRELIAAAGNVLQLGYNGGDGGGLEWAEKAEKALTEIRDRARDRTHHADIDMWQEWQHDELDAPNKPKPISCGFPSIDHALAGGFHAGELVVIGARTSMGKTAFALNMARNAMIADTGETPKVSYYSYEMSGPRLARRMLSAAISVPLRHLRTGMNEDEKRLVYEWGHTISHIHARTRNRYKMGTISQLCERISDDAQNGFRVIFIDYLGLIRADNPDKTKGEGLLAEITGRLKDATDKHNISIVALSQLSRALESRTLDDKDRKPQMSDLRGSGAIEQDADVVLLLYRPDYYFTLEKEKKPVTDGIVIVGKNRDGARSDEIALELNLSVQQIREKAVRK